MSLRWRLMLDEARDGATNMALDHALARLAGQGMAPATLRLYRWKPACVSLGYFQPWADVNHKRCQEIGLEVVRRPTGGRAILHATELTYAITAPMATPGFSRSILKTYETISLALQAGLSHLAVPIEWTEPHPQQAGSAACFDTSSAYELTVEQRKLVGSAQTRTHGGILQHGTILLAVDRALLQTVLHLPPELTLDTLAEKMIALNEVLATSIPWEDVAQALIAGFAETWNITWEHGELSEAEWRLVEQLKQERYANPEWLQRR